MLLGFKKRFAPLVEEGSKTHTIRARRKVSPRKGEICHCYTGLRQKGARLLGRFECVKVQSIYISGLGHVRIDDVMLDRTERNALAWVDGFRSSGKDGAFLEMFEYWTELNHSLPFDGDLIHWRFQEGTNVAGD